MAGYYGIIQSVVKRGYDTFQVTFRVHQFHEADKPNPMISVTSDDEPLVFRVDVSRENDQLILFPDRELAQCLSTRGNPHDEEQSDADSEKRRDVSRIADRLCRHVGSLFFEETNYVNEFRSKLIFDFKQN